MTLMWRTVAKDTIDRAGLDDHYFQCGDTEAGAKVWHHTSELNFLSLNKEINIKISDGDKT